MPGGAQGPDILPPPLVVVCCLSCYCPFVPSLSVSLLLHSAKPRCFGSDSVPFPSGFHPSATAQSLFTSFFTTFPIHHPLFLLTSSLIWSVPAIPSTSLFVTCCCHLMQKILLRHLIWKMSSFFSSFFDIFHVSQPYRNTESTSVLKSIAFVFLLMPLTRQILLSLLKLAYASAVLFLVNGLNPGV